MQRLEFEAAWDRTIAPQDRKDIETLFYNNPSDLDHGIAFTFLWEAINHRGDMLVAVLIQNYNDVELSIRKVPILYKRDGKEVATDRFTLPFIIKGKTTMPWTFIYSRPYKNDTIPEFEINGWRRDTPFTII